MKHRKPHVVIRADASHAIGTGHVMRCLNLADGLRQKGMSAQFVCSPQEGHVGAVIEARGYPISWLPRRDPSVEPGAYRDALAIGWRQDADDTVSVIKGLPEKPDWLVADHYSLAHEWEAGLRPFVGRILAIDDLTGRRHDCDLLLNQNLVDDSDVALVGEAPGATVLLGPQYALMEPRYAALHERIPLREGPIERLLIFLGDAGGADVTGMALQAFLELGRGDIVVDLVPALRSPHADRIREMARLHPNVHVHQGLPSLAPLIAQADFAIGASGATSWERLCLGLPSLVIALAENQRPIARALHRHGLARWISDVDQVSAAAIRQELEPVLASGIDPQWSRRCYDALDGKGVGRVTTMMLRGADALLGARHVRAADSAVLNCWTDGTESGRRQVRRQVRDLSTSRWFVVEAGDGVPVGSVRFLKGDSGWAVEGHLVDPFRGDEHVETDCLASALLAFRAEEPGLLKFTPVRWTHQRSKTIQPNNVRTISVCTDAASWINPSVAALIAQWSTQAHSVNWVHDSDHLPPAEVCFFLSYGRIVSAEIRQRSACNLVVHESELPKGRGWSPLTWQILEGRNDIAVTLFEAADAVDSGQIYAQTWLKFDGGELIDELRAAQAAATQHLCRQFVAGYPQSARHKTPQTGEATYYRRRVPADSQLDPERPLSEQLNLLRVADDERYPAWMDIAGHRFHLRARRP